MDPFHSGGKVTIIIWNDQIFSRFLLEYISDSEKVVQNVILGVNLTKSSEMPLYKGEAGGEVWVRYLTYTSPEPHLYLTRNLTRSIVRTDCVEVRLEVRYE